MQIIIDARSVNDMTGGIGNYTYQILRYILSVDNRNRYILISNRDGYRLNLLKSFSHCIVRIVPGPSWRWLFRDFWEQVCLPLFIMGSSERVFFSPYMSVPQAICGPSVVTIYDLTFFAYPEYYPPNHRRFWRTWVPRAIKKAKAVIAISHYTRELIERLLPSEAHKIKVIYLGVGNKFHPNYPFGLIEKIRKRYNLPREYLLTVGGIGAAHKNLKGLLEGYGILVDHHKINHHLVVVGDIGKDPLGIVNSTCHGKMAEKIHFLDCVPEEDLPIIYNGASVFITASYAEGFGLPIVEAMSCGIPVVGSNVTAIPEIMGGCGMLFDPRRSDELAQKVIQLLSNLSLREEFIVKGIERSKQFSWDSAAKETLSLLEAIY